MNRPNPLREKSYLFALHIVQCARNLMSEKKEYVLSKQLLKSGTSIGANVEEGLSAPSKKDFVNKLSISLKEARETEYWLRLLRDSSLLSSETLLPLMKEIDELIALLTSIIKTSRASISS
jgi:four helix bundle protein